MSGDCDCLLDEIECSSIDVSCELDRSDGSDCGASEAVDAAMTDAECCCQDLMSAKLTRIEKI